MTETNCFIWFDMQYPYQGSYILQTPDCFGGEKLHFHYYYLLLIMLPILPTFSSAELKMFSCFFNKEKENSPL